MPSRLIGQLRNLERRASPMGRDRIDHPPNAHDDLSNSAAGALVLAAHWSSYDNSMDWVGGPEPGAKPQLWSEMPHLARFGITGGL
jgi:hypothetical protein